MLIGALHCWENFQLNFNRFLLLSSVPLNTLVVTVFWIFSWALLVTPLHLVKTLFEVSGVDITLPILQPGWPYQWVGSPKHIFLTSWKINCVWISQSALDISRKKTFSSYKFQHSLAILDSGQPGWEVFTPAVWVQARDPLIRGGETVVELKLITNCYKSVVSLVSSDT